MSPPVSGADGLTRTACHLPNRLSQPADVAPAEMRASANYRPTTLYRITYDLNHTDTTRATATRLARQRMQTDSLVIVTDEKRL